MNIAKDVTELIGRTPLVQLNKIADDEQVVAKIAMKLETYEPLASVKDRIAKSMIDDAEEKGLIERNKTVLIEPTSGNTGIGLAMVAAARGYKCILVMPDSLSIERRMVLLALGAEVVLTPKEQGLAGALEKANQLAQETPNAYQLNQFKNPANPKAHFETTGPEIWKDTDGKIDIFVSGVGTAGTIMGCKRYFDTKDKKVYTVAVEPDESAVLSGDKPGPHGIQGIGAGVVPPLFDKELVDEVQRVTTKQAMEMSRRLSKEEGVFVGISAGAAVQAAINIGKREENKDKLIVVIIPSFGERYFSTELFLALKQKAEAMTATRVVMPTTV